MYPMLRAPKRCTFLLFFVEGVTEGAGPKCVIVPALPFSCPYSPT
jgi:hypothetical protein